MRRMQPDNLDLESEDQPKLDEEPKSPGKQLYPRRFPRIGSQFQTRISKDADEPCDRGVADEMSIDFPYLSVLEAMEASNVQVLLSTDDGRWNMVPFDNLN